MDIAELRKRLEKIEQELMADMTRTELEARASSVAEVQDSADGAVSDEAKEALFQKTSLDWNIYAQVRDALARIKNGTYGKCIECGAKISEQRLQSVPWTPYCVTHQKREDRRKAALP